MELTMSGAMRSSWSWSGILWFFLGLWSLVDNFGSLSRFYPGGKYSANLLIELYFNA